MNKLKVLTGTVPMSNFGGMAAGAFFGRMAIIKYFNGFRMGYETVVE